jgi:hypothetical protein
MSNNNGKRGPGIAFTTQEEAGGGGGSSKSNFSVRKRHDGATSGQNPGQLSHGVDDDQEDQHHLGLE